MKRLLRCITTYPNSSRPCISVTMSEDAVVDKIQNTVDRSSVDKETSIDELDTAGQSTLFGDTKTVGIKDEFDADKERCVNLINNVDKFDQNRSQDDQLHSLTLLSDIPLNVDFISDADKFHQNTSQCDPINNEFLGDAEFHQPTLPGNHPPLNDFPIQVPTKQFSEPQITPNSSPNDKETELKGCNLSKESFKDKINKFDTCKNDESVPDSVHRICAGYSTDNSSEVSSPDFVESSRSISVLNRAKMFGNIINNDDSIVSKKMNTENSLACDVKTGTEDSEVKTENTVDREISMEKITTEDTVDRDVKTENVLDRPVISENTVDGNISIEKVTTENTVDRDVKTENALDRPVITEDTVDSEVNAEIIVKSDVKIETTVERDVKTENIVGSDVKTENTVSRDIKRENKFNSNFNMEDTAVDSNLKNQNMVNSEFKIENTIHSNFKAENTVHNNLNLENKVNSDIETKNNENTSYANGNRPRPKEYISGKTEIISNLDTAEDKEQNNTNAVNTIVNKIELQVDKREFDKIKIDKIEKIESFPLRHCESIPNITTENNIKVKLSKHYHPIYRLSLRFSQYLPHCMEIPNADSLLQYDKAGYLQKQIGRGGFPYLNQWKRRYCVLTKGRLFLYEKESSKGSDKTTNVVDLKYFDHVAEAVQKETKKASNVFVVTSQDRSFFDPGRHLFAADTLTEMHDWVSKLREAIELIRNNNRPTPKSAKGPVDLLGEAKRQQQLQHDQKQLQEDCVDGARRVYEAATNEGIATAVDSRPVDDKKKLEEKLKRESSEIKNGALSITEKAELKDQVRDDLNASKRSSTNKKIVLKNPNFNIESKPQLESITKHRIKGPSGRRAPQSRRTLLMKERASSMTALQHDGDTDATSRSGSAQGFRTPSILTADGSSLVESVDDRMSRSSKVDCPEMNVSFDDIESALFFQKPSPLREAAPEQGVPGLEGSEKKRKSLFSFRNFGVSRTSSERGCSNPSSRPNSVFRTPTFKFSKFRSSSSPTNEHPDSTDKSRRCVIL